MSNYKFHAMNEFRAAGWIDENDKYTAQLIVAECMSYMEDGDIDFAKFMIKKHFGVK